MREKERVVKFIEESEETERIAYSILVFNVIYFWTHVIIFRALKE